MSLSKFNSMIRGGYNLARKFNYDIHFIPPRGVSAPGMPGRSTGVQDTLFRCETFGFPGQNISTSIDDIRTGPAREHAFGVTYAPITATFLSSAAMTEKKMFTAWHYLMIDAKEESPEPTYRAGYYKDYVTDIKVRQFNDAGKNTYSIKLIDAFPKTIVQQDLALADGEFHRLSVEFVFYRWVEIATSGETFAIKEADSVEGPGLALMHYPTRTPAVTRGGGPS